MSGVAVLDGIDDRDIPKMELLTAAFNNDLEKIDNLMRNGQVHIDSTDDDDVTALHIAAAMGNNNLTKRLLDYGANIESCNQLGLTAFHHAAREGKLAVIDTLLQRGANYKALTYMGVNALTLASAGGHADVVKKLLSLRDENWRSSPRNRSLAPTPLIAATCFKSSQICNYLTRAGAAIDETVDTLKGLSALSTAILCTPGVYMVTSLLDLGANQSKRTLHRYNAMELAKALNRKDILNVLYEKRAPRNKLESQFDIRKHIAEDNLPDRVSDQPSQDGCTLLMFATIVRSINSAKLLLSNNIDINTRDNMHITALQIASLLRIDELIQLYLSRSAQTTDINKYGVSAYDLFLHSSDVLEATNLRMQLHPNRPPQLEMKLNFSSSSSSLYKTFQTKGWLNKMSSQIFLNSMEKPMESKIEPKHWLEAITLYQPAKERNSCKFASVEEILRGTKPARSPESNPYDMQTDALRNYMEECQSFQPTCFCDFYGEKEAAQNAPLFPQYDIAQNHAATSGYATNRKFPRNSLVLHRKDSIDRDSLDRHHYRKPRTFSMVESQSQNQMRTTPRMLKKSRDLAENTCYSVAPRRSMQVPTVVVGNGGGTGGRPRQVQTQVITDEMIWSQFMRRNQRELMKKLMKEEIDHYSFMSLTDENLQEMNIASDCEKQVIKEIQRYLQSGSL
ncbi:unnamed protein product [Caenorhabditis angaria]|uniref:ANK_REP_REGION domain-containing protein n=1 Tax=Caenorhabditis angaria TaxID=860376 RepID=A0A9P1MWL6_9PELO|nr:unnamed protein product [Caenorhabditis angaria]